MKHFKSIEAIEKASIDALKSVDGIHQKNAEDIYLFFHNKTENSE